MKRLFLALDISGEARAKAADHARELRDEFPRVRVGWEKPEKMHLTLRFLGESDDALIGPVIDAARAAASRTDAFEIAIRGCGCFPSARRPQTIWLGVADEPQLIAGLRNAADEALAVIGLPRETRRFTPHLTIGRIREPERAARLANAHLARGFESDVFEVSALSLFESRLDHRGSLYSTLASFALGVRS
jgi:2'-5' RNA ligase